MLEQTISGLLKTYFFDDAMLQKIGVFLQRGEAEFYLSTPILPAHPGYSQARVDNNYRQGRIYSPEDWRDLKLLLKRVRNWDAQLESVPLSDEQIHTMPYELEIDRFEMGLVSQSEASLLLQAESLSLSCYFQALEYSDSFMKAV